MNLNCSLELILEFYLIFATVKPVETATVASSSSTSSEAIRQTSEVSVGTAIKNEPQPNESDEEVMVVENFAPQKNGMSLSSSAPSSALPKSAVQPTVLVTTVTASSPSLSPLPNRVTRTSSRRFTPPSSSTPSTDNKTIKVNQNKKKSMVNTPPKRVIGKKVAHKADGLQYKCKQCEYSTAWMCQFARHLLIHNDSTIDLNQLQCEQCTTHAEKR